MGHLFGPSDVGDKMAVGSLYGSSVELVGTWGSAIEGPESWRAGGRLA